MKIRALLILLVFVGSCSGVYYPRLEGDINGDCEVDWIEENKIINFNSATIQELSKQLKGKSDYETGNKTHSWIVDNIDGTQKQTWFGKASYVLAVQQGQCSGKSILFTALMRANGIPTRILEGWWTLKGLDFKNKHLWCEFWDNQKEEWVFVDTHSLAGGSFETLPPVIDYYFVKFCDTSTNDCYMAEPDDSINERYFPESQKMEIPGDTDGNDDVSDTELLVYIDLWTQGLVGGTDLLTAIEYWAT